MRQQQKPQAATVIYISLHSSDSADPPNYLLWLTHFYIFQGNEEHFLVISALLVLK